MRPSAALLLGLAGLFVCAPFLARASELYFYLAEAEPLCFYDDLALESTILIKYQHPDFATKPVVLRIYDSEGALVADKHASDTGRMAHAAKVAGEHRVCVSADPKFKAWPAKSKTAKVSLRVDVVSSSMDVSDANLAKISHVKGLEAELNDLSSVVDLVLHDMELARERETHFRAQSERISSRVVWWSVIQTVCLVVVGVVQSLHLQSFFISKKIA